MWLRTHFQAYFQHFIKERNVKCPFYISYDIPCIVRVALHSWSLKLTATIENHRIEGKEVWIRIPASMMCTFYTRFHVFYQIIKIFRVLINIATFLDIVANISSFVNFVFATLYCDTFRKKETNDCANIMLHDLINCNEYFDILNLFFNSTLMISSFRENSKTKRNKSLYLNKSWKIWENRTFF